MYYYQPQPKPDLTKLEQAVIGSFKSSRNNYGTRKIKHELDECGIIASRRLIGRIMKRYGLVSNYTKASYHNYYRHTNQASTPNLLDRNFKRQTKLDIVVSDLTFVRVGQNWHYVCLIVDLWNREIISWSAGRRKTAELVLEALRRIPYRLDQINVFHSDRGKEFDNQLLDEALEAFGISRSLSARGCPYDNAVIESTNHILKTEFIHHRSFRNLAELQALLFDYVHWYNTKRLHSAIGYVSPTAYRNDHR